MNDLEWLYKAINVRSDYAKVWWDNQPSDIKRLGMTMHRVTAFGIADFLGTSATYNTDVFELRAS